MTDKTAAQKRGGLIMLFYLSVTGSSTVAAAKKYYCDKYDPDAAVILEKVAKTVIHNKSSYIIYVNQMSILIC